MSDPAAPVAGLRDGTARRPRGAYLPVAFFRPRIAVAVVAVLLPEARLVVGEELDAADPLGALPGVEPRDDQAQGPAVVGLQGLAVVPPGRTVPLPKPRSTVSLPSGWSRIEICAVAPSRICRIVMLLLGKAA